MITSLCTAIPLIFLASCGPAQKVEHDPELMVYADRFVAEARSRSVTIDLSSVGVRFEPLDDILKGGKCSAQHSTMPVVNINTHWWKRVTDTRTRENVVFHELGHCALKRAHDPTANVILGIPTSIMHPNPLPPPVYAAFREYYLDELFSHMGQRKSEAVFDAPSGTINAR